MLDVFSDGKSKMGGVRPIVPSTIKTSAKSSISASHYGYFDSIELTSDWIELTSDWIELISDSMLLSALADTAKFNHSASAIKANSRFVSLSERIVFLSARTVSPVDTFERFGGVPGGGVRTESLRAEGIQPWGGDPPRGWTIAIDDQS